jgi:AcrB/AcrD/AcrF family
VSRVPSKTTREVRLDDGKLAPNPFAAESQGLVMRIGGRRRRRGLAKRWPRGQSWPCRGLHLENAGQDVSVAEMAQRQVALDAIVLKDPAVAHVVMSLGGTGNALNAGRLFITLKPRDQCTATVDQIVARLDPQLDKIAGAKLFMQVAHNCRKRSSGSVRPQTICRTSSTVRTSRRSSSTSASIFASSRRRRRRFSM